MVRCVLSALGHCRPASSDPRRLHYGTSGLRSLCQVLRPEREVQNGKYGDSPLELKREEKDHRKFAFQLHDEIASHCASKISEGGDAELWDVHVRCFLMDLRGSVMWLKDDGSDEAW